MADRRIKIVTRKFQSGPNRYLAYFDSGNDGPSVGDGEGVSLDEAIGQLVRTSGSEIGIMVQVPEGKLDEPQQAEEKDVSAVASALRRLDAIDQATFACATAALVGAMKLMGLSDLLGPDGSEALPNGDQIANARRLAVEARSSLGEIARLLAASSSDSIAARRSLKGGDREAGG